MTLYWKRSWNTCSPRTADRHAFQPAVRSLDFSYEESARARQDTHPRQYCEGEDGLRGLLSRSAFWSSIQFSEVPICMKIVDSSDAEGKHSRPTLPVAPFLYLSMIARSRSQSILLLIPPPFPDSTTVFRCVNLRRCVDPWFSSFPTSFILRIYIALQMTKPNIKIFFVGLRPLWKGSWSWT